VWKLLATVDDHREPGVRRNLRVALFVLLSLALHGAMATVLRTWAGLRLPPVPQTRPPLRVTVIPDLPAEADARHRAAPQARQIVDAPVAGVAIPPPDATLLGVRDQSVPREQIARELGEAVNRDGGDAGAAAQPAATPDHERSAMLPEEQGLDGRELARYLPDVFAPTGPVAPVRRAAGQGASTQRNAIDRPTGPVTLLNTKSSPFAQYLIDRGHRALRLIDINAELATWYASDVNRMQLPAVVVVRLDGQGEVLSQGIERSSGSAKVDRLLLTALAGATRGAPPPPDALEDGEVEILLALEPTVLRIGIR
jgi:hypothetical protein